MAGGYPGSKTRQGHNKIPLNLLDFGSIPLKYGTTLMYAETYWTVTGVNKSAMLLPVGNTTDRNQITPAMGMLRFNSQNQNLEFYDGTTWRFAAPGPDQDNQTALEVPYSPDNPGLWSPTPANVKEALDILIDDLSTLTLTTIQDADGDTRIQTTIFGPDDDIIAMFVEGIQITNFSRDGGINFFGVNGASSSGDDGKNISFQGGSGTNSGVGGNVNISGGSATTGNGGDVVLAPGNSSFGNDGSVVITSTSSSAVDFKLYDIGNSNFVALKAKDSLTTNTTYSLPEDGTNGQILSTDGSGNLYWSTSIEASNLSDENLISDTERDVDFWTFSGNPTKPKTALVEDDYLYVSLHEFLGGFEIYDISSPQNPQFVSKTSAAWSVNNIVKRGDFLYGDNNNNPARVQIFDISDPTSPTLESSGPSIGGQLFDIDVSFDGNWIYAASATGLGLRVWDATNKSSQTLQPFVDNFNAGGVAVNANTVFITNYSANVVRAYDISTTPGSPVFLGASPVLGGFLVPIYVKNDIVVAGDYNGTTFYILDASNPASMTLLSTGTVSSVLPQIGGGFFIDDNDLLYINHGQLGSPGITVFDISNPSSPELVVEYILEDFASYNTGTAGFSEKMIYIPSSSPDGIIKSKNPAKFNLSSTHTNMTITSSLKIPERTVTNSNDPGETGQIFYDNNYIYICVAPDTWRRVATTSW